jgi:hypothetical protein
MEPAMETKTRRLALLNISGFLTLITLAGDDLTKASTTDLESGSEGVGFSFHPTSMQSDLRSRAALANPSAVLAAVTMEGSIR